MEFETAFEHFKYGPAEIVSPWDGDGESEALWVKPPQSTTEM